MNATSDHLDEIQAHWAIERTHIPGEYGFCGCPLVASVIERNRYSKRLVSCWVFGSKLEASKFVADRKRLGLGGKGTDYTLSVKVHA